MKLIAYLERRLGERSFWGDIAVAITAAAVLPKPWAYLFVGISAIKALVPDAAKDTSATPASHS